MRALAPLALDHAGAPAASRRQFAAVGTLALAMAVLGALRLADLRAQEQSLQGQATIAARANPVPRPASPPALPVAPPWDRMFAALETAAGPDVSLLAFDPAPERRQVRLEGEARNLPALLAYMRVVGATSPFVRAELQSHQASHDDPRRPVRFTLELSWRESQ